MALILPNGHSKQYVVRIRNYDGKIVKVPGDRDWETASRIDERVQRLVTAKQNGDDPPGDLAVWIANMSNSLASRLIKLGLIPARQRHRHTPLCDWVDAWVKVVRGRKPKSERHAEQQGGKVRRLLSATAAVRLEELDPDAVTEKINAFETLSTKTPKPLAASSRRSYGIAIKDFSAWLAGKFKIADPLTLLVLPGQYEDPEYERQPLTVAQFQKLMAYLDTFNRYKMQKARWTAHERKLVYWTAVKTGYRQTELSKLRRWNLFLDEAPAVIGLKARHNKNKQKGEVPIPRDLATALHAYVADLEPDAVVFPFPSTSGSIVDMLRRDLDGAGIPWRLPSGEVIDFHAFRSTAITWWLDVDGLKPKRVQVLSRLKSISMLNNYSRNLRIEEHGWLDQSPRLVQAEVGADPGASVPEVLTIS